MRRGIKHPEEADAEAYQAKRDAEFDLVETEPTTHAGIVALLAYVDDFHTRAFADPDDPKWYSQPEEFEDWEDEQMVVRHNGKPLPLSFTFWIMHAERPHGAANAGGAVMSAHLEIADKLTELRILTDLMYLAAGGLGAQKECDAMQSLAERLGMRGMKIARLHNAAAISGRPKMVKA